MSEELKDLWVKTEAYVRSREQEIIDTFINFLREVAKYYLQLGRLVYFRENTTVHYGEGGFGELVIQGNEDVCDVFGTYICEVSFEPDVSTLAQKGYTPITEANLESIRYVLR